MELVIASHNLHKVREFRELLKRFKQIDVFSLLNFSSYALPLEEGETFEEIAVQKALHASKTLQKWVLADDSGLVVPALNGEPGIRSRRYASEDATDAENRKLLLEKMHDLKEGQRAAYFECCLVLAAPEGVKKIVTGTCEGEIIGEERGMSGFGYDMVFIKNGYKETFGQLKEVVKNQVSHRYKALEKLFPILETLNS